MLVQWSGMLQTFYQPSPKLPLPNCSGEGTPTRHVQENLEQAYSEATGRKLVEGGGQGHTRSLVWVSNLSIHFDLNMTSLTIIEKSYMHYHSFLKKCARKFLTAPGTVCYNFINNKTK